MLSRLRCLPGLAVALAIAGCGEPGGGVASPGSDAGLPDAERRDGSSDSGPPPPGRECRFDAECDDAVICNGNERCYEGHCRPGVFAPDGTVCERDGLPNTPDVCADGECVRSACGDRVVDVRHEQCDDGNTEPGDGCMACLFECESDADCADGRECDGEESCHTRSHTCAAGSPLPDGTACAGEAGTCLASVCLLFECSEDLDCSDGDACNGPERCTPGGCALGEPPTCDDVDDCTEDSCDSRVPDGCVHHLIDGDADGYAPASLACGTDCDDLRSDVHPGAVEVCDSRDNDCDGAIDEDSDPTWYADCDGDGSAAADARTLVSCMVPSGALTGCPGFGHWSAVMPGSPTTTDCNDANRLVYPGQTTYQAVPIPGAPEAIDFDYNCDGIETPIFEEGVGRCEKLGRRGECDPVPGWLGDRPACGEAGLMVAGCRSFLNPSGEVECVAIPSTTLRTQRCL